MTRIDGQSTICHWLKIWPAYFYDVREGRKQFEVRRRDRDYMVGDSLALCEWDPLTEQFSGRYVLIEVGGIYDLDGRCVLGFLPYPGEGWRRPIDHVDAEMLVNRNKGIWRR